MHSTHTTETHFAPELETSAWINTESSITLAQLRGKVVAILAFQLLCPACVKFSLPQMQRIREAFSEKDVMVLGLHCVFEQHQAMTDGVLQAFLHQYRITFPVGIDLASTSGPIPKTMDKYHMNGTPTLLLIDREGRLRRQFFGEAKDLLLGAEIMALASAKNLKLDSDNNMPYLAKTHSAERTSQFYQM